MQYVKIAKVSDFAERNHRSFSILARKIGVFKSSDGEFFAIEVACKHQNWDLTTGRVDGMIAECPRHGWRYDLSTGECLNHDSTPLRKYGLRVEGDDIYVSLTPLDG